MKISGFQKITLLDYPGLVACTVFVGGCNFRCPFCHNAEIVTSLPETSFSEEEILDYIGKRRGVLDGVCVTGGEPLLYGETLDFLRKIKETGLKVKLDTNGSFPDRLAEAVGLGLVDHVAMDVKNTVGKYSLTSGAKVDTDKILQSISFLISSGISYEFRTTVVREFHTEEDIVEISEVLKGAKVWYLQQFVDSGNLIGSGFSAYTAAELEKFAISARKSVPETLLRGI